MGIIDFKSSNLRKKEYTPSQTAQRYYNYYLLMGWQIADKKYKYEYQKGIGKLFMLFTVSGEGAIVINNKTYRLSAGTVAIILPDTPMIYYTHNSNWQFYWLDIDGFSVIQKSLLLVNDFGPVFNLKSNNIIYNKFEQLLKYKENEICNYEFNVSKYIDEIIEIIIKDKLVINDGNINIVISQIIEYFESNYDCDINLNEICETYFISINHLIRIFEKQTGDTPYGYLKKLRLIKSCELLTGSNYSVKDISKKVGFNSTSNFIFQFKKMFGITPSVYSKYFK